MGTFRTGSTVSWGQGHVHNGRITLGQVLCEDDKPLVGSGREEEVREGLPEEGAFEGWTDRDGQGRSPGQRTLTKALKPNSTLGLEQTAPTIHPGPG